MLFENLYIFNNLIVNNQNLMEPYHTHTHTNLMEPIKKAHNNRKRLFPFKINIFYDLD